MRFGLSLPWVLFLIAAASAQQPAATADQAKIAPAKFVDVTSTLGVSFQYKSSHTAKHYLPETMGAGVALFDYDNDGRLDIFLVNGAPISDPTPKGTIPQKTGPSDWNRLYHQKVDGTFQTSPKPPACKAWDTGWASPSETTTTMVTKTCT